MISSPPVIAPPILVEEVSDLIKLGHATNHQVIARSGGHSHISNALVRRSRAEVVDMTLVVSMLVLLEKVATAGLWVSEDEDELEMVLLEVVVVTELSVLEELEDDKEALLLSVSASTTTSTSTMVQGFEPRLLAAPHSAEQRRRVAQDFLDAIERHRTELIAEFGDKDWYIVILLSYLLQVLK
ncbi:hypothetical protein CPB84DRAFT_1854575 [Gymnopilus junonius]|uniref:Uncharacterized protein n=1 Tax=Gymnopilus junonius TaxID=109634 RepID=A0A9P5N7K3_GYMJU|nr:hypothetical protein CPB84DRAFT_1854575 [Gymnopilus junonius]